ncbi:hypothetical protein ACU4GI_20345 [Cupriavidus basilensis]
MIEQNEYLAPLSAPELASGAASVAGSVVDGVGRRFAASMCDKVSAKLAQDTGIFSTALFGAIGGQMNVMVEKLQESAGKLLSGALHEEGAALADAEELRVLRKLAADAAEGRDIAPVLAEIRQFYVAQTASAQI